MKSETASRKGYQAVTVVAFIDPNMHDEVDFRFLPSGTRFLSNASDIITVAAPRRLIIASNSSSLVREVSSDWLEEPHSAVEILWNPSLNPDFAYSLLQSSRSVPYSSFRQTNDTAHLVLAHLATDLISSNVNNLTPELAQLLEESATENVSIPPQIFKQLLWRYTYLLDQIEPLAKKAASLQEKLNNLSERPTGQSLIGQKQAEIDKLNLDNQRLVDQLGEMTESLSTLQARYDALSNSKLGSLALKYWNFRKRKI